MRRIGEPYVFGVVPEKLLESLPAGEYLVILSPDDFARVRTGEGSEAREFYVKEVDGKWVLGLEIDRSSEPPTKPVA